MGRKLTSCDETDSSCDGSSLDSDDNDVKHCCKCNVMVKDTLKEILAKSQFGYFYNKCEENRCGHLVYCKDCRPPITFYIEVGPPYSRTIEIPIPSDNEYKLCHTYFFDAVADELSIPVERVTMSGKHKEEFSNCFLCPAEYVEKEHKTFKVTIV